MSKEARLIALLNVAERSDTPRNERKTALIGAKKIIATLPPYHAQQYQFRYAGIAMQIASLEMAEAFKKLPLNGRFRTLDEQREEVAKYYKRNSGME